MEAGLVENLSAIAAFMRSQTWEKAAARNLTPTQGQILVILERSDHPLRLGEVSQALGVTAPTASNAVSALLDKGLVHKVRLPEDRRAVMLSLTRAGMRAARDAASWPAALGAAASTLSTAEKTACLRGVTKILRELQARATR